MADALDEELLALAGDSEEEQSHTPQHKESSPAPSNFSHSSHHDRDRSPEPMARKGIAKSSRSSRKVVGDEEGELSSSETESHKSAPMSDSDDDSEPDVSDAEDKPIFPYDKLYYSAKEKDEIMAMPEIQREELLSERAQQVDRHHQDLALRRLLKDREREEAKAAKRKAGAAGLDDNQRKSSRQKTTLGGRKVGETSAAIDAYKRQREQKGKRDQARPTSTPKTRRRSSASSGSDDPPAELRDIQRARVGRSNFAQVVYYPHFEERITGCYARVNIGINKETGMNEYRLCLITGITEGKPYGMESASGRPFVVKKYAKLAHGKAVREFPFIACSDSPFTEAEYNRYRKTMAVEDCKMATQLKVASKVADINRLINHTFTEEELAKKLRQQGALNYHANELLEYDLERKKKLALDVGDKEEADRVQKEIDTIHNPKLSWGTAGLFAKKQPKTENLTAAERLHDYNIRIQKLNHENVRKAQIEERKAARKAATEAARAKSTPKVEEEVPKVKLTPKKKTGFMITHAPTADDILRGMDWSDIDVEIEI
ncbi:hypothetical protein N7532_001687 [Penicillium argentinense]|uniref:Plus3 domain-containing protein n=1 Tax=Penicillium argentinense TaxID=1131581 RepID=A0A9W9KMR3_9EURO|nr:uncharacterized protein N7532_001687 [Penicillium argentinense]KAJ5111152.1 hypothetical protein N7532_001687 [Penicillium argentinense]